MKDKKVLAGGAVLFIAAFWFYIKPHYFESKPATVYTEQQIAESPFPAIELEERVLNLKAPSSAPNYVKATIALEFEDPDHKYIKLKGEAVNLANLAFAKEHEADMPRIWDVITSVVGGRTIDQVSTSEGREQLKTDLVEAINKTLAHEKVQNVFFAAFITQ
jgi:flagellar basal body-associated protein FliL